MMIGLGDSSTLTLDLGPGSLGIPGTPGSGSTPGDSGSQPATPSNSLNCGPYNCGALTYGGGAGPSPTPASAVSSGMLLWIGLAGIVFVLVATTPGGKRR